jgi:hypothetical protein
MPGLGETIHLINAATAEWIPKIIREMAVIPISKLTLWLGVFGVCLGQELAQTAEVLQPLN